MQSWQFLLGYAAKIEAYNSIWPIKHCKYGLLGNTLLEFQRPLFTVLHAGGKFGQGGI